MPKTVSANDAETHFDSIADWVVQSKDEVIVESDDEPKVVIIPFEAYQQVAKSREQARRQAALAKIQKLRAEVQARNQDLTSEDAEALADRFVRDVIADMIAEGKIVYETE